MPVRSATAISGATCCGPSLRDVSWTCPARRVMDVSWTAGLLGSASEVPRKCLGSVQHLADRRRCGGASDPTCPAPAATPAPAEEAASPAACAAPASAAPASAGIALPWLSARERGAVWSPSLSWPREEANGRTQVARTAEAARGVGSVTEASQRCVRGVAKVSEAPRRCLYAALLAEGALVAEEPQQRGRHEPHGGAGEEHGDELRLCGGVPLGSCAEGNRTRHATCCTSVQLSPRAKKIAYSHGGPQSPRLEPRGPC